MKHTMSRIASPRWKVAVSAIGAVAALALSRPAAAECRPGEVACANGCMPAGSVCCGQCYVPGGKACCGEDVPDPANPGRCLSVGIDPGETCCAGSGVRARGCFAGQACGVDRDAGTATCVCQPPPPVAAPQSSPVKFSGTADTSSLLGFKIKADFKYTPGGKNEAPCTNDSTYAGNAEFCVAAGGLTKYEECAKLGGEVKGTCAAKAECPEKSAVAKCNEDQLCCKQSYKAQLAYSRTLKAELPDFPLFKQFAVIPDAKASIGFEIGGTVGWSTEAGSGCTCKSGGAAVDVGVSGKLSGKVGFGIKIAGRTEGFELELDGCLGASGVANSCGAETNLSAITKGRVGLTKTDAISLKWGWFKMDAKSEGFKWELGGGCK